MACTHCSHCKSVQSERSRSRRTWKMSDFTPGMVVEFEFDAYPHYSSKPMTGTVYQAKRGDDYMFIDAGQRRVSWSFPYGRAWVGVTPKSIRKVVSQPTEDSIREAKRIARMNEDSQRQTAEEFHAKHSPPGTVIPTLDNSEPNDPPFVSRYFDEDGEPLVPALSDQDIERIHREWFAARGEEVTA